MNNLQKYNKAFMDTFDVKESVLGAGFSFENVDNWDSVAHMSLITAIEDAFEVMLDTDDILNFTSYEAGKTCIQKYEVKL